MLKFRITALIIALLSVLSLCACGDDEVVPQLSGTDVAAVSNADVSSSDAVNWFELLSGGWRDAANTVLSSTDAFNAKDIEGYMATVDPESESREETAEYAELIFKKYDLTAEIENIEAVSLKGETAELRVTQKTVRNGSGKAFADVRTVLLHTMVCRDGVWYISSTVVESRTELNSDWDILTDAVSGSDVSPTDVE